MNSIRGTELGMFYIPCYMLAAAKNWNSRTEIPSNAYGNFSRTKVTAACIITLII